MRSEATREETDEDGSSETISDCVVDSLPPDSDRSSENLSKEAMPSGTVS